MRGMFEWFKKVAKAGGVLPVRLLFPGISVVSHTPDQVSRWLLLLLSRRWRRRGARVSMKVDGPCGPNLQVALCVTDELAHYWGATFLMR